MAVDYPKMNKFGTSCHIKNYTCKAFVYPYVFDYDKKAGSSMTHCPQR